MKLFRKQQKNDEMYTDLRQQVFKLKPNSDMLEAMNNLRVYAAVVDMDMKKAIASLISVADGTTSLYLSTGGGQIGYGNADEDVRNATITFLRNSEQFIDKMEMVSVFPLPKHNSNEHIVYLVTEKGVFRQKLNINNINHLPNELRFFFTLYQNVLTKMREFDERSNKRQ